ncbi:hypothetical protein WDV93_12545 [Pantoea ananatis]
MYAAASARTAAFTSSKHDSLGRALSHAAQASKPVLADLFSLIPGVTRIDAVTVEYQAERMGTLISLLSAFSYLASTQSS